MTTTAAKLLKPAEVGQQLGVSRATVYRLITSGDLATVGVGVRNATRVEDSEVDRYIKANRRSKVAS